MATLPNACAFTVSNTPGNSSGFVVAAVLSGPYRIPRAAEDGAEAFVFVREGDTWEICASVYDHATTTWSRGALSDSSGASVARQSFSSACIVHVVGFVAEDVAGLRGLALRRDASGIAQAVQVDGVDWGIVNDTETIYFDRFALEAPQHGCPTAISGYTRGAMVMRVTAEAGSAELTYQSGAPVVDGGAGPWPAVLYDGHTYRNANVLGISGSTITLARALDIGGELLLCPRFDSVNGQHLSSYGAMALADMLIDAPLLMLTKPGARTYSANSSDGVWYQTPWVSPYFSPQYWRQYGGLPNNMLNLAYTVNISSGTTKVVIADQTRVVSATCANVGEGAQLVVTAAEPGVARLFVGHSGGAQLIRVSATLDGRAIYSVEQGLAYTQHIIPFAAGDLVIMVSSLSASSLDIRISNVHLEQSVPLSRPLVRPGERILLIGDSWVNPGAQGAEFVQRLRDRATSLGAAYVASEGVSGTTADYHLAEVGGTRRIDSWLVQHAPTTVVVHSYINDINASRTLAALKADLDEIARTVRAAGGRPVIMLPGVTASETQVQTLLSTYGAGKLVSVDAANVWITQALQAELANVGSYVNKVQKTAGRTITNTTNSAEYAASGSAAADPWVATGGGSPSSITPS